MLSAADGGVSGGNLVIAGPLVHVDNGLVLVADIFDHGVDVDTKQVGGTDQQHADGQHAHGSKGHKPVGSQVVQALADQISKAGKTHGIPSYLFLIIVIFVLIVAVLTLGHAGGVAAGSFGVRSVRGDHAVGQLDDAVVVFAG